jgi:hypothetical protein
MSKSWGDSIRLYLTGEVKQTSYHYVTGQAGRVTNRRQSACQKHGEAFAKKHGLPLPGPITVPASHT